MAVATEEMAGGILRVILDGRLDIEGTKPVDMQMNIIAGSRKLVLVDLQNVFFFGIARPSVARNPSSYDHSSRR